MDMPKGTFRKTPTRGLTTDEVRKICRGHAGKDRVDQLLCVMEEELEHGFEFLEKHPKMITFLGSARTEKGDPYYEHARSLGYRIVDELGVPVATGGGPGIMEAGNKGAFEAGGESLGMTIELPFEQSTNPFVNEEMDFHFFFTRKVIMFYASYGFVFFPGGFGTLNEFFETVTLMQTHKMQPVPLILFGSEFWNPLQKAIVESDLLKHEYIDPGDANLLYVITDSEDEVIEILSRSFPKKHKNG